MKPFVMDVEHEWHSLISFFICWTITKKMHYVEIANALPIGCDKMAFFALLSANPTVR